MTNGQGGTALAFEVTASIATEYGWPDFRPEVHIQIKVDPEIGSWYS